MKLQHYLKEDIKTQLKEKGLSTKEINTVLILTKSNSFDDMIIEKDKYGVNIRHKNEDSFLIFPQTQHKAVLKNISNIEAWSITIK